MHHYKWLSLKVVMERIFFISCFYAIKIKIKSPFERRQYIIGGDDIIGHLQPAMNGKSAQFL